MTSVYSSSKTINATQSWSKHLFPTNYQLTTKLATKLTAPTVAGAANQVLSSDGTGGNVWKNSTSSTSQVEATLTGEGKYVMAVNQNSSLYTSSDYGLTYTIRNASGNYKDIACSANGKYCITVALNAGNNNIITSSDYGVTWFTINPTASAQQFMSCKVSASGKYMIAVATGWGIYISNNYGLSGSFTINGQAGYQNKNWTSCCVSSSGKYMTVATDINVISRSSDFGNSFADVAYNFYCQYISMSASGMYQIATGQSNIYKSTDYGVNWSAISGSNAPVGTSTNIITASAMSDNGNYITVVQANGYISVSKDIGATWTQYESVRNWSGITMTATGKYQYATSLLVGSVTGNQVYKSSDYGVTWAPYSVNNYWIKVATSSGVGIYTEAIDTNILLGTDNLASNDIQTTTLTVGGGSVLINNDSPTDVVNAGLFTKHGTGTYSAIYKKNATDSYRFVQGLASQTFTNTPSQYSDITVKSVAVNGGALNMYNSSSQLCQINQASSQTGNIILTLPTAPPIVNQILSCSNATNGVTSWTTLPDNSLVSSVSQVINSTGAGDNLGWFGRHTSNLYSGIYKLSASTGFNFVQQLTSQAFSNTITQYAELNAKSIILNLGSIFMFNNAAKFFNIAQSSSQAVNVTLTLPTTAPAAGQSLVCTNATAGIMDWTANAPAIAGVKAFINFNAITHTINNFYGFSFITYLSTGRYEVNFSTAMPNANYCSLITCSNGTSADDYNIYQASGSSLRNQSVSYVAVSTGNTSAWADPYRVSVAVFSQ